MASPNPATTPTTSSTLVVATRLHMGSSATPPSNLPGKLQSLCDLAVACRAVALLIAVDVPHHHHRHHHHHQTRHDDHHHHEKQATDEVYSLLAAVKTACEQIKQESTKESAHLLWAVVPVTPWGRFVPALNALIGEACARFAATRILFVSAEMAMGCTTTTSSSSTSGASDRTATSGINREALQKWMSHLHADTLVVGAVLPGHDYCTQPPATLRIASSLTHSSFGSTSSADVDSPTLPSLPDPIPIDGRTCPWNTFALWDLTKLARTGFLIISDGLLTDPDKDPSYGVEEVVASCLLQRLLSAENAKAKLVPLPGISWDLDFQGDEKRMAWHEAKMQSKLSRAARQLELMGLSGQVYHLR